MLGAGPGLHCGTLQARSGFRWRVAGTPRNPPEVSVFSSNGAFTTGTSEEPHRSFGVDLVGQSYERAL